MRLGLILKKWRLMSELDLRAAAKLMDISASTLMRIESGSIPDGAVIIKLNHWLFETVEAPNGTVSNQGAVTGVGSQPGSTDSIGE